MEEKIIYRMANLSDVTKLSILFKQVYIQTYGLEGVSDEFANFITKQFSIDRLTQLIETQPNTFIVASYKNNLIGAAEIEFKKQSPVGNIIAPELNKLYILEWFCGKSVGYNLLVEAEKLVTRMGGNEMWLWVLETNKRAIKFYERQHYTCIGNASFQMEKNKYENKVMYKRW